MRDNWLTRLFQLLPAEVAHRTAVFSVAATLTATAQAEDRLLLNGTYLQNKPCLGDGTDLKALLVKITPKEIEYSGGQCSIDDQRHKGNSVTMRTTCKTRRGAIMSGDVTFSLREDGTISLVDQDRSYRAVLYKCPGERDEGRSSLR